MMYFVFNIEELAYTYIQPQDSKDVIYDNEDVKNAFTSNKEFSLSATVWPNQVQESNFRMALSVPKEKLYSEVQLLAEGGLNEMIDDFTTATKTCPQYVILYSSVTPCEDICSEKIEEAKESLKMHAKCKDTPFYHYVETPEKIYKKNFLNETLLAPDTGIILLNDPGRRPSCSAKRTLLFNKAKFLAKKIGQNVKQKLRKSYPTGPQPLGMRILTEPCNAHRKIAFIKRKLLMCITW